MLQPELQPARAKSALHQEQLPDGPAGGQSAQQSDICQVRGRRAPHQDSRAERRPGQEGGEERHPLHWNEQGEGHQGRGQLRPAQYGDQLCRGGNSDLQSNRPRPEPPHSRAHRV